jgi:hypothetical protein
MITLIHEHLNPSDQISILAALEQNASAARKIRALNVYLFATALCTYFQNTPGSVLYLSSDVWRRENTSTNDCDVHIMELNTELVHLRLNSWIENHRFEPTKNTPSDAEMICYQQASGWTCPSEWMDPCAHENLLSDSSNMHLFRKHFMTEFSHVSFEEFIEITEPFIAEELEAWTYANNADVFQYFLMALDDGELIKGRNVFLTQHSVPKMLQALQTHLGAKITPLSFPSIQLELERLSLMSGISPDVNDVSNIRKKTL